MVLSYGGVLQRGECGNLVSSSGPTMRKPRARAADRVAAIFVSRGASIFFVHIYIFHPSITAKPMLNRAIYNGYCNVSIFPVYGYASKLDKCRFTISSLVRQVRDPRMISSDKLFRNLGLKNKICPSDNVRLVLA